MKAYLRYEPAATFGVVASSAVEFDATGKQVLSAALENVAVWSIKQGALVRFLNVGYLVVCQLALLTTSYLPAQASSLQPSTPSTSSATGSLSEVTVIVRAPHAASSSIFAAGYSDGSVR